eukprot:CAMPEP_0114293838 /NCGR_PEP_ID=MMETSP0059-20121206/9805_1 /TAXON_ID=36894 /ORGANISM="Pyramimonas parkeae, Strain CCMP726" /LENGTH=46 /DNA_ID= /DNA_START= /DNA_END= /DNA_ORIENTATION=
MSGSVVGSAPTYGTRDPGASVAWVDLPQPLIYQNATLAGGSTSGSE